MSAAAIIAINARRLERGKNMVGIVDLKLPSRMIVKRCSVHRRGSHAWINLPGQRYRDTWKPAVEFADKESAQRFQELAIEAVRAAFPELVEEANG